MSERAEATRWIYHFTDPLDTGGAEVRKIVGGKGASLRDMTAAGLPVPQGFTITTACCQRYFALGRRWPDGLEAELRTALGQLESQTGRRFGDASQPLLVSVRSGAAVSMPGMMDTLLNCGDPAHGEPWDQLVAAVNAVFESWLSERAVAYRAHHDIRGLAGTAVTVQAMFPSEIAGIAFTQDPTDCQAQRIVIEAAYGLGEVVVSGEVTPDRFLIPRSDLSQCHTTPGKHGREGQPIPCLSLEQVKELAGIALRIEKHFSHPVDIEWAWAAGRFTLLQSRPIRGLEVLQAVEPARLEEVARLQKSANGQRRVWVTHNLAETLRFPTPLTWDFVRGFMTGDGGFGLLYQQLGYRPSKRVRADGFLELIGGRIYADPDRLAETFWEGMPLAYDLDALSADRTLLDRAPSKFDANKSDGFLWRLPGNLLGMWGVARNTRRGRNDAKRRFEQDVLPGFLDRVARQRAEDLQRLTDEEVLQRLDNWSAAHLGDFAAESLRPGFFGGMAFAALEGMLVQLMGEQRGAELARTLTLALEGDVTFEQDALLYRVAQGQADLGMFLERFGHRCIGEMELSMPRWREQSGYLEQTVARLRANPGRSPDDIHSESAERYRQARTRLRETLREWGGSCFQEQIEHDLDDTRALLPFRESGKFYLMMGYEQVRRPIEELARRWDLGRDIYFLQRTDLPNWHCDAATLRNQIAERKIRWHALQKLDLPEQIDSAKLEGLGLPQTLDASQTELAATAMAPGVASGPARIVFDPHEAGDLGAGYILVCPSTDPGWTPLFLGAHGLIVERGGVLSHGAIVARDFGIPAVACPNATRLVKAGSVVRVDGNAGRVVLE
jgi:pyruvate,water dikinase